MPVARLQLVPRRTLDELEEFVDRAVAMAEASTKALEHLCETEADGERSEPR